MIALTAHAEGTIVPIKAQPGARKNAILGEHAGALRVAVSAAPERGKANEAIRTLLADKLGVRAARIELLSGETSREKKYLIRDTGLEEMRATISQLIATHEIK